MYGGSTPGVIFLLVRATLPVPRVVRHGVRATLMRAVFINFPGLVVQYFAATTVISHFHKQRHDIDNKDSHKTI